MDKKYILKNLFSGTILRIFALGVSVIVAFFMMPFMVHSLGDTQYGLWVIIGTITGYYGFLDFGLAPAAARYIAQAHGRSDYKQMNIVSTSSLFLYAILGVIVLIVSCIGALLIYWYADNYALELALSAAILGVAFAVQFPSRVFGGILRSYIRHDMIIGIEVTSLIFRTLLVVHFVMAGHGIVSLSIISFAAVVLSSLLEMTASIRVFKEMSFKRQYIQKPVMKSLFAYSKIAFVANLTDLLKISLSPVFVAWIINVQTVVLYAVAFRLLEYFGHLFSNLIKMVTPIFSQLEGRNSTDRLEQGFIYTTMVAIIATLFVGLNLIYFGQEFILLWMGEKFEVSYHILWIVGISFIGFLIQMPSKELLFGTSNHKYYAIKSTIALVTASSFSVIFGHLYGLYGFAVGLSVGILLPEFILPYIICKVFKFSFVEIYIKKLLPIFLKTLFTLGVIFSTISLSGVQLNSYLNLIWWAACGSISFGIIAVEFILPKNIRDAIHSIILSKLLPRRCRNA